MRYYGYGYGSNYGSGLVAGIIITIVLTILVYIFVMPESNNKGGFLGWLKNFFKFKKLYIEAVVRFFYILVTVACVSFGFVTLFSNFLMGLLIIIVGVIVTRLAFELTMLTLLLVKNVIEINNHLSGKENVDIMASAENLENKFSNSAQAAINEVKKSAATNNNTTDDTEKL